jgi:hydrogenase/urease accessory protein HupE
MTAPSAPRRRLPIPLLAAALGALPAPAAAHLVTTGLGPFYDGVSHLAVTPEDLLPVLALGLLAGLRGAETGRRLLWLLPVAWLAGGLAGLRAPAFEAPLAATASFLLLGILVAADAPLPLPWISALGAAIGALHGFLDGAAIAATGLGSLGVLGMASGVWIVVALTTGQVVSLRAPWARVAVRVAGSWIAATGLLLLGWILRPTGTP